MFGKQPDEKREAVFGSGVSIDEPVPDDFDDGLEGYDGYDEYDDNDDGGYVGFTGVDDFNDFVNGVGSGGQTDFDDREDQFEMDTGRFRDPDTGEFQRGSPPNDYDSDTNRYRGNNGRFKNRSADLYDERQEVAQNDLSFRG